MKTFKQHLMESKPKGVIPVPIHFKHVLSVIKRGVIPVPIHFKNKLKGKKLNEEEELGPYMNLPKMQKWIETSENDHLVDPGITLRSSKHASISKKLITHHVLTPEHKDAIRRYTSSIENGNSEETNGILLGRSKDQLHRSVPDLSDAIDKNPLQHELHVYSGLGFDPHHHRDTNRKVKSPAFISATHSKSTARNFAQPTAEDDYGSRVYHIMHLHLKPGDPALHVEPYSSNQGEHESIIQKGVTLHHHGSEEYHHLDGREEEVYTIHHMSIDRNT